MRFLLPSVAVCFIVSGAAAAATGSAAPGTAALPAETRYDRCLALAGRDPREARDSAEAWRSEGGGAAASHCLAVALVGLRRYAEAALVLDALARDPAVGGADHRAVLFAQAGNAWLLARKPDAAETSLSEALRLAPSDIDALTDRARAKAMRKDWTGADADLTAALERGPRQPDLLVLRASARRAEGRNQDALADIDAALRLKPGFGEALLERGALKLDAGDKAGARSDWQQVLAGAPNGPVAESARKNLDALDRSTPAGTK